MRRRKWTSNGQFRHQNDSGYDNSFPTRHFPSKIEKWNIMQQQQQLKTAKRERGDVESHLGGVGVGGLRRGVNLHGLVDAKALLRGEHPHKSSSKPLSFSLSLWTHLTAEAAAVQDYKPETFFFYEKRMLEMLEEIGSVKTETNRPRIFGARKRQLE